IRATVIGRVTDTGRFRVYDGLFDALGVPGANPAPPSGDAESAVSSDEEPIADVPVASLGDGPVYHRPAVAPPDLPVRQAADPPTGARLAVIEAARNLACVGAEPRALVNCLNFGNPEHADVMWQFSEVTEGLREACGALRIPVVGGNVSFYNESRGLDIDPTP